MNIIAAADLNNGIGLNGSLIYSIPEDMEFFKKKTTGKTVVMGRKTFDSLRIKPLPGRRNIVLTKNPDFSYENTETVHSVSELMSVLENIHDEDIYVIGGESIYSLLEEYCDTAFITRIYAESYADSFISDFENSSEWKTAEVSELKEHNGIKFRFFRFVRL